MTYGKGLVHGALIAAVFMLCVAAFFIHPHF